MDSGVGLVFGAGGFLLGLALVSTLGVPRWGRGDGFLFGAREGGEGSDAALKAVTSALREMVKSSVFLWLKAASQRWAQSSI